MKEVNFSVKITAQDYWRFLLQHSYRGLQLIADCVITVGAAVFFVWSLWNGDMLKMGLAALLMLLFTVIYPLQLYRKARKQVKNPVFLEPIQYVLNDEGVTMSQKDVKESFLWSDIFEIRETKHLILVYTGSVYACIWPKSALTACEPEVRMWFNEKLEDGKYGKPAENAAEKVAEIANASALSEEEKEER